MFFNLNAKYAFKFLTFYLKMQLYNYVIMLRSVSITPIVYFINLKLFSFRYIYCIIYH